MLVGLLVVPLVLAVRQVPWRRRVALAAVALAGTMAVLAPWTIRNVLTFDRPVLVSNGDGTLLGANCDRAYHGDGKGLWFLSCYSERTPGDEAERTSAWRRQGIEYARDHTSELPAVVAARVGRVWDVYAPMQNADYNGDDGRPAWSNGVGLGAYVALVVLAVPGIWVLRNRRIAVFPLLVQWVLVTITAALVWGAIRFRVPAEMTMTVLGAAALVAFSDRMRSRAASSSAP